MAVNLGTGNGWLWNELELGENAGIVLSCEDLLEQFPINAAIQMHNMMF